MDDDHLIDLTPEELKAYLSVHDDKEYELIDVRQPEEYGHGHIPGATLMPLVHPDKLVEELKANPREILFYCSSGNRSEIAGCFLLESDPASPRIYNLQGGFNAWNGGVIQDFPKLYHFPPGATLQALLETAMNMEKGAYQFYETMARQVDGSPHFNRTLRSLLAAEERHARKFFDLLPEKPTGNDFGQVFEGLSGNILEGGGSMKAYLSQMDLSAEGRELAILDTALAIEYAAYDLYRAMAVRSEGTPAGEIFRTVAQSEKNHILIIAEAMGKAA
jgi:rhodanese-related sulfurtransferase/rubrerythrin